MDSDGGQLSSHHSCLKTSHPWNFLVVWFASTFRQFSLLSLSVTGTGGNFWGTEEEGGSRSPVTSPAPRPDERHADRGPSGGEARLENRNQNRDIFKTLEYGPKTWSLLVFEGSIGGGISGIDLPAGLCLHSVLCSWIMQLNICYAWRNKTQQ